MFDSKFKKTIFLVDDDPDVLCLLQEGINESGLDFNVFQAFNGHQLIGLLTEDIRNVVILIDMNMPLLTGTETLKAIYADPAFQHVRSILMSTSDNTELKNEALNSGAMKFLCKPTHYQGYVSLVNDIYNKCF